MELAQVPGPIAAGPVKAGKLVHVLERFAPMAPGMEERMLLVVG